jgi:hypothetical protein
MLFHSLSLSTENNQVWYGSHSYRGAKRNFDPLLLLSVDQAQIYQYRQFGSDKFS